MINNLRKWRKAKNVTQEELTFLSQTTAPTISSYECGCAIPSFNTMIRLADALKIAPVQLFAFNNENLTIEDKELQYILVEKFKNIPFAKRKMIFAIIDTIIAEENIE